MLLFAHHHQNGQKGKTNQGQQGGNTVKCHDFTYKNKIVLRLGYKATKISGVILIIGELYQGSIRIKKVYITDLF